MAETPNRVPSGVPTGGQFAASAKAESGVSLASPTDTITDIGRARLFADTVTAKTARFGDLLACAGEARDIHAKHPTARYAVMVAEERRAYDDLGDQQVRVHVFDQDFEPLDEYVSGRDPLRYGVPAPMCDEPWTDTFDGDGPVHFLDVTNGASVDIGAAETAYREDIAFAAVNASAFESFIVTPAVVSNKVGMVLDDAAMSRTALSEEQEAEVVRRVMDDEILEQAFYPTHRAVDALVKRHVEDVYFAEIR